MVAGATEYVLAVDLGGTHMAVGLVSRDGKILRKHEQPTLAREGMGPVLDRMVESMGMVLGLAGKTWGEIAAVGVGIPGAVDTAKGLVIFAPNLRWQNEPVGSILGQKLGKKVFIGNDANLAALGENWYGAGKGTRYMVCLTLGTGVGGGIIIDGQIYQGARGSAGEIGHMTIKPDGPLCSCGNHGCLEALVAAPAIVRRVRQEIEAGHSTLVLDLAGGNIDNISARKVFKAAEKGDRLAEGIVQEVAYYLGIGVANLINILNPDMVVIGGGVSRAGEALLGPVRTEMGRRVLVRENADTPVVAAALGNDAGIIGAAALAFSSLSSVSSLPSSDHRIS